MSLTDAQIKDFENLAGCDDCSQEAAIRALAAEVRRLREENDKAKRSRDFAQDWYGQRFERLRRWIDEEIRPLSENAVQRYFAICANGSADPYERPEWRDTIHGQTLRAEQAERQRDAAKAALARAVELLREHSCSCGCVFNPNGKHGCTARDFAAEHGGDK